MKSLNNILVITCFAIWLTACGKESFSSFFKDLATEIPQQTTYYKIEKPKVDTLIIWYSPYKIFENKTKFDADTITHSEQFNWQGMGEFLWEKYEERKARRKAKQEKAKEIK